jgi:hypothetical protein
MVKDIAASVRALFGSVPLDPTAAHSTGQQGTEGLSTNVLVPASPQKVALAV